MTCPENAQRIVAALADFGFPEVDAAPYTEFDRLATLGKEPVRIDIFTHIPCPDFATAWSNRLLLVAGEIEIPFIGKDHYISSKRAAGRPKDLADLELLCEVGEL